MSEEALLVGAVVVRKRDAVGGHVGKTRVAGARESGLGSKMQNVEAGGFDDLVQPVVRVLVDEDQPKAMVRLKFERSEELLQLLYASDRRDDEVERRKLPLHGP